MLPPPRAPHPRTGSGKEGPGLVATSASAHDPHSAPVAHAATPGDERLVIGAEAVKGEEPGKVPSGAGARGGALKAPGARWFPLKSSSALRRQAAA